MQTDYVNGLLRLEFVTMKIKHYKSFRLHQMYKLLQKDYTAVYLEKFSLHDMYYKSLHNIAA